MLNHINKYYSISTKLLSFRLFTLSFIVLFIPFTSYMVRGYKGFLPLIFFSFIFRLSEKYKYNIFRSWRKAIRLNKLLFFFVIWYLLGSLMNHFIFFSLSEIWLLLLEKFTFFIGFFFAFSYIYNSKTLRYFQIFLGIMLGIQCLYSIPVFFLNVGIAREMYSTTHGAWLYGSPGFYSLLIVLLPCVLMRAFLEKGNLKIILFISALAITIMATISSFGTPLGLLIAGLVLIVVLSTRMFISYKGCFKVIIMNLLVIIFVIFAYKYISNNILLEAATSRIENAYNDPTSGGYTGQEIIKGSRYLLAQKSFNQFLNNPFLGGGGSVINNPKLGGHSSFFDLLGAYGLLGGGVGYIGIIIVMLFNSGIRYFKTPNRETLLIFTAIILYAIVGVVNPYWEGLGFVIVFIMTHPYNSQMSV